MLKSTRVRRCEQENGEARGPHRSLPSRSAELLRQFALLGLVASCLLSGAGCAAPRTLARTVFLDKLQGAWVGQMVGVAYGAPYEFRSPGRIDDGDIRPWQPQYIANAIEQDDLYVEMTWLMCLEDHGLGVTPAQAGAAFAATQFPLWHANAAGRDNVRKGLMPPDSGAPPNNLHANDIDYQIEADAIGIICPGLPQEANRLGWTFAHVMNFGDGVYGGLFIQGMYCAAYFEGSERHDSRSAQTARGQPDPLRVVQAALACIPAQSRYAACIRDVITWWRDDPRDWRTTWQKVEAKYNDDRDCERAKPFNINAHLNGAYVVMGLLYGGDDLWKVCEIATRCGQDSDCNPSSAAGVWGCMHGLSGMPQEAYAGLPAIANQKFQFTRYSYNELLQTCRTLAERIIVRTGGRVVDDAYVIVTQPPRPTPFEHWEGP